MPGDQVVNLVILLRITSGNPYDDPQDILRSDVLLKTDLVKGIL